MRHLIKTGADSATASKQGATIWAPVFLPSPPVALVNANTIHGERPDGIEKEDRVRLTITKQQIQIIQICNEQYVTI